MQSIENIVTSLLPISISQNIIVNKQSLKQRPLQYRALHLHFDSSDSLMEEEDITQWIHLEPPTHERMLLSLPLNKNTKNKENEHPELPIHKIPLSHKNVESVNDKNIHKSVNNKNIRIKHKLYAKINFLKSENVKL